LSEAIGTISIEKLELIKAAVKTVIDEDEIVTNTTFYVKIKI